MADYDGVRQALLNSYKELDRLDNLKRRGSAISLFGLTYPTDRKRSSFRQFESKLLNNFHTGDPVRNQISIARFTLSDTNCQGVMILRLLSDGLFRIYFRGTTPTITSETYDIEEFSCIQAVLESKKEMIQSDEDVQALALLVQWKPLFSYIPDVVLVIPVLHVNQSINAVVALSFKRKLPSGFMTQIFPEIKEFLLAVVPYAMMIQSTHDYEEDTARQKTILESLDVIERDIRDPEKCSIAIGLELAKLTDCRSYTVLSIDCTDSTLTKLKSIGKAKPSGMWGCLHSECHETDHFNIDEKSPVGWVATTRKPLKLSDSFDCQEYGLERKAFHSVMSCLACKNLLCIPVNDHSAESSLVVELVDKEGGFTLRDFEIAISFSQSVAALYSCSIMAANKEKVFRRNSMLNKIILNIEPVKRMKVEQFMTQQRRISMPEMYTGRFLTFPYTLKSLADDEMNGGIIHIFLDMNFITLFKIRKTTLIRFILSAQQGYRPLPYHNWQHACSVTHFSYLLIKNLRLIEEGYITHLEAFAMIVSGLVHDIDHRGTNNRFQSGTNSELFQLYNTQESIMERHHLSIATSILRREDCNLIENLTSDDYKEFIELLTWNILATDIAKYLHSRDGNFKRLKDFKKGNKEDRLALLSLMMTAADVNDCVKPWDENLFSIKQILTEFFDQGDMEKELGMTPMPMMDRYQAFIPEVEYKFLSGIVFPVYRELGMKFPLLKSCVDTLVKFQEYWEISTIVFDTHKDVADQLSILEFPEMKEEALKKAGEDKNNPLIKRFGERPVEKSIERRGTVLFNRIIPHIPLQEKILPTENSNIVINPEEEFRQMFTESQLDTHLKSIMEEEDDQKQCCCFGSKKKKDKILTLRKDEQKT